MKFGVLTFSYSGSAALPKTLAEKGFISTNLGDNVQTLAVRRLYAELGVPASEVIEVDRDTLAHYDGEPVVLPMNGCFVRRSFPIPDRVVPIFVGFQTPSTIIRDFQDYFRRHEPIGCRDVATAEAFGKYGVRAFVSGCLTLTFQPRQAPPEKPKTLVVYGAVGGEFPAEALRTMPASLLSDVEFVYQRKILHGYPLTPEDLANSERHAAELISDYGRRATLIVTSLHHAAAPCIAMGIPTVICRKEDSSRFGHLKTLLPVHLAPDFDDIEWAPRPIDVSAIRASLVRSLTDGLRRSGALAEAQGPTGEPQTLYATGR